MDLGAFGVASGTIEGYLGSIDAVTLSDVNPSELGGFVGDFLAVGRGGRFGIPGVLQFQLV